MQKGEKVNEQDTNSSGKIRYHDKMAKKKAAIDQKIASADQEKGLLIILTGAGKGKSSSAFGMVARALGHGMKVGIVQYIKGRIATGEQNFFERFDDVSFHVMGAGFTWDTQDKDRDTEAARAAWEISKKLLSDPKVDLVVLDELNLSLKYKHLTLDEVLAAIKARPPMQHVVITGRSAPAGLIESADTVSEIKAVKHAYEAGIKAQKGIEW